MDVPDLGDALPKRGNRFSQWMAQSLMSIFGWRIEADIPNQSKLVLVGAPHTSNWDFLLTMGTLFSLGVKISWMGKKSLFGWPFKGVMKWLGGVPIDRTNKSGGIVEQTIEAFNSRGKFVIAIMPEVTRSRVRQWKTGFYHIAHKANLPIYFAYLDYPTKTAGLEYGFTPSGDMDADMEIIRNFYKNVKGKYPEETGEIRFKPQDA